MPRFAFDSLRPLLLGFAVVACPALVLAQPVVPGTGEKLVDVGDDFEDEKWGWQPNEPKASSNIDQQARYPLGVATSNRVYESGFRGQPDVVKRVLTPEGGLPGSKGSLLMQTLHTGIPGRPSFTQQQDDLMLNVNSKLGYSIPSWWGPSFVVRVYIPPFEKFDPITAASLGIRADCHTTTYGNGVGGLFRRAGGTRKIEPYWPGFFLQFNSKTDPRFKEDSVLVLVRSGPRGEDLQGPLIKEPGWWTFGMSFTGDGQVHYYAKKGVENLTAADHLTSQSPYGYRCEQVGTFFFNVCSRDDGRSWSTPWIVDDPAVYVVRRQ